MFALSAGLALAPISARADSSKFSPGASGAGDSYYPLDGNGGYDVQHYTLDVGYDPPTDTLTGVATITATATQNLSAFDFDLVGLTVRSITVNGRPATWTRDGQELVVVPARGIRRGAEITTVVRYDGVPETLVDDELGWLGFFHTRDGEIIAGEPHGAASWFPANDHPSDKASFTFHVTVPTGLAVLANGALKSKRERGALTSWTWEAREPMATYLATVVTGKYDVNTYRAAGVNYRDAIDSRLSQLYALPKTGSQFAITQIAENSYKRLARTIDVPAGGATVSFQVNRNADDNAGYAFVEAHTVGADDWTTLPDLNGHTAHDGGESCQAWWLDWHPFLQHYLTQREPGMCEPSGTTGDWWAATGTSQGYEPWSVDLSAYAGKQVELSISYASNWGVAEHGLFLDDVVVSTGAGSTSFEDDGDTLDGWTVPGAPEGSAGNPNDWVVGTTDLVHTGATVAKGSLKREPEIIKFLSDNFGKYPFGEAGGIVTTSSEMGFALETQTRPVYGFGFFEDPASGDSVVLHELAHQWFGDSLALRRWKDIWLNEGFASYAEWLWSEHEGEGTAQELFDFTYASYPADDPFWQVLPGDPGATRLFDGAVYDRGALTLHALRLEIGDDAFFNLLRTWTRSRQYSTATTAQFIALAEQISGKQLDDLFTTWLYTPGRPDLATTSPALRSTAPAAPVKPRSWDLIQQGHSDLAKH